MLVFRRSNEDESRDPGRVLRDHRGRRTRQIGAVVSAVMNETVCTGVKPYAVVKDHRRRTKADKRFPFARQTRGVCNVSAIFRRAGLVPARRAATWVGAVAVGESGTDPILRASEARSSALCRANLS